MDYGSSYEKNIMFFKESNNFLTNKNKKFIEEIVLGNTFPFYFNNNINKKEKGHFLTHIFITRLEDRPFKSHINSTFYSEALDIVNSFFKKLNIKYEEIYRMAINITFNNKFKKCHIHKDHLFPHKQLIIYLNDADSSSKTIILNDKKKVLKKITPEKYKGICFDSLYHYHFYPKTGARIVLVVTFK
jgi:hypothetical protein